MVSFPFGFYCHPAPRGAGIPGYYFGFIISDIFSTHFLNSLRSLA